MNTGVLILEICAVLLGLIILILEVSAPSYLKGGLGIITLVGLALILLFSYTFTPGFIQFAFGGAYVMDGLALFSKKFFIATAILVVLLLIHIERQNGFIPGEYYALIVFALTGMMFAASANHLVMLFVSIELVTVSFYILTGFRKQNRESLEAAIKYLIFGAVSSAFLIFGIALVYGTSGTMAFNGIAKSLGGSTLHSAIFHTGLGMILVGLGFKIAMFPFQLWVPDVYQGAPSPTTAFLATGSKAAGFVLIIRLFLNTAEPAIALWREQLIVIAILTILYGNLCAIPQRNIKRLIGYSSIAHAGYLLMGIATIATDGIASILYYLVVYMLAVVAMFGVIAVLFKGEDYDIGKFSGLHQRSPFLAMIMTCALASLAGIPPLAGFFGKFLLIKSAALQVDLTSSYYYLVAIAIVGVAISIYYYFKIIKLIYWGEPTDQTKLSISYPLVVLLVLCMAGMLCYGIIPSELVDAAKLAAKSIAM